jgi:hypothetical protein
MNDDHLTSIDRRGAAAAADVQARAAARPVPAFDAAVAPVAVLRPRRSAGRAVAVAAVVLALVGAAAWVGGQGDGDDDAPTQVRTTLPDALISRTPPVGLLMAGAGEVSIEEAAGSTSTTSSLVVYGPAADDPRIGVVRVEGWDDVGFDDAAEVEVDGRTVRTIEGSSVARTVALVEDPAAPDAGFVLISHELRAGEAADLVVEVEAVGGRPAIDPSDLPDGWRELGDEPDGLYLAGGSAAMGGGSTSPLRGVAYTTPGAGSMASEESSSGSDGAAGTDEGEAPAPELPEVIGFQGAMVVVATLPGDEVRLHAARLAVTDVEEIEVRGHPALLGTIESAADAVPATNLLTWLEAPGVLVRVSAWGLERSDLLAMAESLEPVAGAEWTDLLERAEAGDLPGRFDDSSGPEIVRGEFDDGTRWSLRGDPDDPAAVLQLDVSLGGDSSSSSSGFAANGVPIEGGGSDAPAALPVVRSLTVVEQGGRRFAAGVVGPEAMRVELRDASGAGIGWSEVGPLGDGPGTSWFVVELPPETTSIAVLDLADATLDDLPIDGINVDPDGVPATVPAGEDTSPSDVAED